MYLLLYFRLLSCLNDKGGVVLFSVEVKRTLAIGGLYEALCVIEYKKIFGYQCGFWGVGSVPVKLTRRSCRVPVMLDSGADLGWYIECAYVDS